MPDRIPLKIYDIVGSPIWVSTGDGQRVYDKLKAAFKAGCSVELSFKNRQVLITAFLNAAIGQLYNGEFSENYLTENLTFTDIDDEDRKMLDRAVSNAKRYFADPKPIDHAWKEEVGDEDE